ncbi:MAG: hypothetical protein JSS49_14195 [Planctomycetes bacterium]|nr:hypothetical protein [Planctomycetota bacterium]
MSSGLVAQRASRSPSPAPSGPKGLGELLDRWSGTPRILSRGCVGNKAEPAGQLDPQSLAAQSVDVLIGRPSLIAGRSR